MNLSPFAKCKRSSRSKDHWTFLSVRAISSALICYEPWFRSRIAVKIILPSQIAERFAAIFYGQKKNCGQKNYAIGPWPPVHLKTKISLSTIFAPKKMQKYRSIIICHSWEISHLHIVCKYKSWQNINSNIDISD